MRVCQESVSGEQLLCGQTSHSASVVSVVLPKIFTITIFSTTVDGINELRLSHAALTLRHFQTTPRCVTVNNATISSVGVWQYPMLSSFFNIATADTWSSN